MIENKRKIIKHNFVMLKNRKTIAGQILEVNWGKYKDCYEQDKLLNRNSGKGKYQETKADIGTYLALSEDFNIRSISYPEISERCLHIYGFIKDKDNDEIHHTFENKNIAKKVAELLDSISYESEKIEYR